MAIVTASDFGLGMIGTWYSRVTDEMVREFSRVTLDNNPIHLDEEYAKTTMFKERIVQGALLTAHVSSALVNSFSGHGTIILSTEMKYLLPVFIDNEIKVRLFLMSKLPNNIMIIDVTIFAGMLNEIVVAKGVVKIKMLGDLQ